MPRRRQARTGPVRRLLASVSTTAIVIALWIAAATFGSPAASGQVIEQPDVVIDFEDLPYEPLEQLPQVSYYEVTDFYQDRGVDFDPPVRGIRFDPAALLELSSFAASGSGFIAPRCPESVFFPQAEFLPGVCRPVAMQFDREMSSISVMVGAEPSTENRTLTLEALDGNGDAIAGASVDIPETGDLTPIETPLTVTVADGGMFGARLYWIGGSTTAFHVDDLGLIPFVGAAEIEARESAFELEGTVGADTSEADAVTVIFDNIGDGPSVGHRLRLVAEEPFGDGALWLDPVDCPDPLGRGQSCAVDVFLEPDEFPFDESGDYPGAAELWFEDSNGEILDAVDLDLLVVVVEPDVPATDTTLGETPSDEDIGSTPTTASSNSDDGDPAPETDPDPSVWVWLVPAAIATAIVLTVRRRRRRRLRSDERAITPPPPPPPRPAPPPPPPSPPPPTAPPYRITVRNSVGSQHITEGDGPLVVLGATRPQGRITVIETTESGTRPAVPVPGGDSP